MSAAPETRQRLPERARRSPPLPVARRREAEPSFVQAVEDVVSAGVSLCSDRIELLRVEVEDAVQRGSLAALLGLGGVLLAVLSWCGVLAAASLALRRVLPPAAAVAVVMAANAAIAVGLLVLARRVHQRR